MKDLTAILKAVRMFTDAREWTLGLEDKITHSRLMECGIQSEDAILYFACAGYRATNVNGTYIRLVKTADSMLIDRARIVAGLEQLRGQSTFMQQDSILVMLDPVLLDILLRKLMASNATISNSPDLAELQTVLLIAGYRKIIADSTAATWKRSG